MQADTSAVALGRQEFWTGENGLWMPPQSSTTAHEIDALFNFILVTSTILTIIVAAAMVYFVVKYRRKSHADRPVTVHESKWLELSWIVLPTILVLVVFFWGFRAYVGTAIPPADAYEINVKGQKWFWTFEYDNGAVLQGAAVVPVGQPIKFTMTSQDVLHSFYVPEFRIKHDVIPNRYSFVWFEAPAVGTYQVLCTEYCGTDHSNMGAKIHVVSWQDFYAFQRGEDIGIPGISVNEDVPLAVLGEQVYQQRNCVTCHSVDGSAGTGPSWLGLWQAARPGSEQGVADENYIRESILYPSNYLVSGFENGGMPSYDGLLNDRQIDGVISYIKLLNGAATAADTVFTPEGELPPDSGDAPTADGGAALGAPQGDPSTAVADPVDPAARETVQERLQTTQ